jgi:GxxExxY protein
MNHQGHQEHKERQAAEEQAHRYPPLDPAVERVVRESIGAAIAVHRALGPGYLEPAYERALGIELECRGLRYERQSPVDVHYRGRLVCRHRLDLIVERHVIVEVKAVRKLRPIHRAQLLSYMKARVARVGLLMNFNVTRLVDGLERFVR